MFRSIVFLFLFFSTSILFAEESLLTLKQQLERLQREIQDISKIIYNTSRDNSNNQQLGTLDNSNLAAFDLRIYDIEKDIKKLNENFEEIIFKFDDLNNFYEELNLKISNILISKDKIIINESNNSDSKEPSKSEDNSLGNIVIKTEDLTKTKNKQTLEAQEMNLDTVKLSPEKEFQKVFDYLRNQQNEEALKALKIFIKNNKENILSGSAHYWLGEIYLLKKEHREAALILAEGYQKYPKSIKAPDMLYKLSDSLIAIDKITDACSTLQKLKEEFPKNKIIKKAENKIASLECEMFNE